MTDEEVAAFREEVCEVAQRLFVDEGYANTGLRALGAEMGVTATALYRYFPGGKEEILAAVRARAFGRFARALERARHEGRDPVDRLRRLGLAYIDFAVANPDEYRLMFGEAQETDDAELAAASARARDALYSLFEQLAAAGLIDRDACPAAHAYWAALHGAVLLHTSRQLGLGIDIDQLLATILATTLQSADVSAGPARTRRRR